MSLASLLSIARSALAVQQRAMDVTAHNVANAQTPGYSRQRLNVSAAPPLVSTLGTLGRGVTSAGISRARDLFSDAVYRRESGLLGDSGSMRDTLSQVESAMNEPSDSGVAAALDGLFASFSDLANDPAGSTSRALVQQAASRFVQRLHQLDSDVSSVTDDALARLRSQVDQLNGLATRIADYNQQILAAQGTGGAPDLEDQRDVLVDQVSGLVGARVLQHADGTIAVLAGDAVLVDGSTVQTFEMRGLATGGFALGVAGGGPQVDPGGGSVGALVRLVDTTLPGVRQQLDTLARNLVAEVNRIHRTGYTLTGATGTDFFDRAGLTAHTIALAPGVAASGDAIAAGGTAAAGDGSVALQLAGLARTGLVALGGRTLRSYYTDVAAAVGTGVSDAAQDADAYGTMADAADTSRSNTSGVSVDEEMVALISQQQAYSAASRLVKAADEMMQDILQML